MTNYSFIRDFSKFKLEDKHLININIFFKIQNIREIIYDKGKFFHINIKFSKQFDFNVVLNCFS